MYKGAMRTPRIVISILALSSWSAMSANDWPQFLGPTRNGVYGGNDLSENWPSKGPTVNWRKAVGHGFSGPVVSEERLILFHRLSDQEVIECLEARTGRAIWSFGYPTSYRDDFGFDDGPRATPAIAAGSLYTFGAEGMLHCLQLGSGKKIWSVDVKTEFKAPKGFFGMACSPLVEGSAVLLNVGGPKGAGIIAFDKNTGKVLWKATDDEASYSSPVAATIGGQRFVLFLTRDSFIALDPIQGTTRVQYPWHSRNRTSVNAATPLILGDSVFLSASYGTGAILLRWQGKEFEKTWSGDDLLSNHYATSVERKGLLFGIHGRADPGYSPRPKLRCVDPVKRTVCWETDSIGAASITCAGDQLLIVTEKGELIRAPATPDGFQPKCRSQIMESPVRAFPALADGFLYVRNKDQLVCLDLRQAK
jgi:outer membrane protein assembly factor BamB